MAKILLKRHSRVDSRDIVGRTPLHYAVNQNSLRLVKLLLSFKANPGVKSDCLESSMDICKDKIIMAFLEKARTLCIMKNFVGDKKLQ